jgi:6-phosphogluconate dehydrogenase
MTNGNTGSMADFGMIGLAVMGRNLAWNIVDHGYSVAVWNLEPETTAEVIALEVAPLVPTDSLAALVAAVERPRRIMMMIQAGRPVDIVLDQLIPLLDPDDIVIDGGNSRYTDTQRREKKMAAAGLRFFGVGVSGGEDGARFGPSLMPGGDADAYERIRPVLEAIAAKSDSGPCVTHVGRDGAGHFVKMVHNGIEYADMQFIAEAYDILARHGGLTPPQLAEVFASWNEGPLASFLIEITAKIFAVADPKKPGAALVDSVLDKAGQKGTGRWTAQEALELGVPIPSIAAAIDARSLSSRKQERVFASTVLAGPTPEITADAAALTLAVHDALFAAKIVAYAQGMALIRAASEEYGWGIVPREIARIWKAGCIIRARFLDTMMQAYGRDGDLINLLLDDTIRGLVETRQAPWRRVIGLAQMQGIPVPALSSSLAYYDSYRTAALPQNLTQAQRDAFGSHTYVRGDDPEGGAVHTDWI